MKTPFSKRRGQASENYYGVAFDGETDEVVVAGRLAGGGFNVWRVGRKERRAVNIADAEVRTAAIGWSAHTDRSQSVDGSGADDEAVLCALVEAAKHIPHANAPSFSWSRTPDHKVTITQAERGDLERTLEQASSWLSEQVPPHLSLKCRPRLRVETVTRALARLWLSEVSDERLRGLRTVAFVTANREGYAIGLWGAEEIGFIYETEELFEVDAGPEMAVAHACESVLKLITASSLARLSLGSVSAIVVSATRALEDRVINSLTAAFREDESVSVERARFSGAEDGDGGGRALDHSTALALGLLIDSSQIPAINLSSELDAEYQALVDARNCRVFTQERRQVTHVKAAIWAPFVLAASVLLASYFDLHRERSRLSADLLVEERRAESLKAEATLRVAAKQHFAEYVALTDQTLELRRRQPATAQLLNDLNEQWPAGDPSWFISEMRTTGGGSLELKGRTLREESVTAFTRGLEFSNGLFTNVSNNIQTASSATNETNRSAPLDFTVRAIYTPLQKKTNPAMKTAPTVGSAPGDADRQAFGEVMAALANDRGAAKGARR